jgi:uncharacterized membrane protein (DUF485 family)
MNSALLNIWRENGAYLRFGDTKNGFLWGISLTFLYSYVNYELISEKFGWQTLELISVAAELPAIKVLGILCFSLSTLLTFISIVPTLSKSSVRTNAIVRVAKFCNVIGRSPNPGIIYFLDIASFDTAKDYQEKVVATLGVQEANSTGDNELIEQIWIISRIAASKHFVFLVSIILLVVGVLAAIA